MIALIDYKAGNVASVKKAFDCLGAESVITDDPSLIASADKLVLPGVGHFSATTALGNALRAAIGDAIRAGKPFLGICVGMQWLYAGSSEAPDVPGLGALDGACTRFKCAEKIPHVGWNGIAKTRESRLLDDIESGSFVYYSHAFRAPVSSDSVAVTEYGGSFSAAVEKDNIFGVQFHPEKSGSAGLQLLRNFAALRAC